LHVARRCRQGIERRAVDPESNQTAAVQSALELPFKAAARRRPRHFFRGRARPSEEDETIGLGDGFLNVVRPFFAIANAPGVDDAEILGDASRLVDPKRDVGIEQLEDDRLQPLLVLTSVRQEEYDIFAE